MDQLANALQLPQLAAWLSRKSTKGAKGAL